MLTALVLAVLARPQTVTFTHPCAHSTVVLEKLGEALGTKMAPGGSVLQDYFAVKFTDRDPETVKRLIAETLNAVWVQRGEYLVLDRGPTQHAEEDAALNQAFQNGIKEFRQRNPLVEYSKDRLRDLLIESNGTSLGTKDWEEKMSALGPYLPNIRAERAIVHALDDRRIFAMAVGDRIVYTLSSDGKTDMPSQLKEAVQSFESEGESFRSIVDQYGLTQFQDQFPQDQQSGQYKYTLEFSRDDYGLVGHLLREPRRGSSQTSVSIHVSGAPPSRERPKLPGAEGSLQLAETARSVLAVIAQRATFGRGPVPPTNEDREATIRFATDLVKNEFLGVVASEPLLQAAQSASFDFVALIPDVLGFDGPWIAYAQQGSLDDVWQRWHRLVNVEIDATTGVVLMRPARPAATRLQRFDRAEASRYVKSFETNGRVTLDALADLMKGPSEMQSAFRVYDWVNRFIPVEIVFPSSWFVLKAFGTLTPAQRAKARDDGVVIPWPSVDSGVRAAISPLVLSGGCTFAAEESSSPTLWQAGSYTIGIPIGDGLLSKETQVPRDAQIKIRVYSADVLRPGPAGDGKLGSGPYDPLHFVSMRTSARANGETNFDVAAVVQVERVNLDLYIPNVGYVYFSAQVDSGSLNTKVVPLDKLPEPFNTAVKDAIKKYGGGN